jgi:hypothetical protein
MMLSAVQVFPAVGGHSAISGRPSKKNAHFSAALSAFLDFLQTVDCMRNFLISANT